MMKKNEMFENEMKKVPYYDSEHIREILDHKTLDLIKIFFPAISQVDYEPWVLVLEPTTPTNLDPTSSLCSSLVAEK